MSKHLFKKTGFIAISIIVIFALIFAIIFLLKINLNKKPKSSPSSNVIFKSGNIFYLDSNGQRQPIDTKIVKSTDPDYGYMNVTNTIKTYFPKNLDSSNNVKVTSHDASIEFSIVSDLTIKKYDNKNEESIIAKKSINDLNQSVGQIDSKTSDKNIFSYPKIYQNNDKYIDINYTIYNNKLSEEIILNKFQDFPELTQHIKLTNAYAKVEGSQINFYNLKTNKFIWYISPPEMYEQKNKNQINYGLYYDLKCDDSNTSIDKCLKLSLTKKFTTDGRSWLSDPSRQYPVVIDPVINNADALTDWATTDSTAFNISLSSTIKYEGTNSIMINCTSDNSCWGISGSCDTGCNVATTTPATVYTTCSSSSCGSGYWSGSGTCSGSSISSNGGYSSCSGPGSQCGYDPGTPSCCTDDQWDTTCQYPCTCDDQYCIYWQSGTPPSYTYYYDGSGATYYAYSISGSCSTNGTGSCYWVSGWTSGTYYYTGCGGCNSGSYSGYSSYGSCSWIAGPVSYNVSGAVTRLTGSGTCNSSGSGTCFKLTQDGSNTYTSSGSCPSSACNGAAQRYQLNSNCSWINKSALDDSVTLTKASPVDLSTSDSITFWVYAVGKTGTFMQFGFGEGTTLAQTTNFSVGNTNIWEQKTWDISGISAASRDAVTKFTFKNINYNIGYTFYFDDIQYTIVPTPTPTPAATAPTKCLINESENDTFLTPFWQDNSPDEDGFKLEKSTNGGAFTQIQTLGAGVTGYQDTSISQGNTYAYRVRSYKGSENSDYCTTDTLNLGSGSLQMEGLQLEGIRLN